MENYIYEPLKYYTLEAKEKIDQETKAYFDDLTKKSKIDVEANASSMKEYYQVEQDIKSQNKILKKQKTLKILAIIGIVLALIGVIVCIYLSNEAIIGMGLGIILGIICLLLGITLIVLLITKINKSIKKLVKQIKDFSQKLEMLKTQGYQQMASLNHLFDWNMASCIISKAFPIIQLDQQFDPSKFCYLHEKYGLEDSLDDHTSIYYVQSGSLEGNPFLLERDYLQKWGTKTYTGSITIHWTETRTDSKGNRTTVHHSQVLTASVVKPLPLYLYETKLIFGSPCCPDLSFSRGPNSDSKLNEKKLEKKVNKNEKKLDKKVQESLLDDKIDQFTKLGNVEFETLFNALNRNHDVQFRLMFTPLAQKSILELLKDKTYYGDDFAFIKEKCLTYVISRHSQTLDYIGTPKQFYHFDYQVIKDKFVTYTNEYFKGLYFDLAPILSIPIYQQTKPFEYLYDYKYPYNMTHYEHEVIVNRMKMETLQHPETASKGIIYKTNFIKKIGNKDLIEVKAHSFKAISHTDIIPTLGGDGKMHGVPVHWLEYLPIERKSQVVVLPLKSSDYSLNHALEDETLDYAYEKGILGIYIPEDTSDKDLEKIINKIEEKLK
jgi:hypothetical protein